MTTRYTNTLTADEPLILTVHQTGIPSTEEINGGRRYQVHISNGKVSFVDPTTNTHYKTPTALCKAMLHREGAKGTNEWRGPRHCLVLRDGTWTPIGNL